MYQVTLAFLSVWAMAYYVFKLTRLWSRLPPGPVGLPILGYLPFLDRKQPQRTLELLSAKYGKVFSIQMGRITAVVIADPSMIRKYFSKSEFSGRAPLFVTHGIMCGFGLICAQGEMWRRNRKWAMEFMKKFGMTSMEGGKESEPKRRMEKRLLDCVQEFLSELEPDQENNLDALLSHTIGNMMNEIIFGFVYDRDDLGWNKVQRLREEGIKELNVAGPMNFLPWLRHVPGWNKTINWLIEGKNATHEEYAKATNRSITAEDCVTKAYLNDRRNLDEEISSRFFSDAQLYHLQGDIFGAGLDTTLTTIKWVVLYLCSGRGEHQERAWREIADHVRGDGGGMIGMADREELPFTNAVIQESMRMSPVVPMGVPHGTTQAVQFEGKWTLPAGTMVMPLLSAINKDPEYWGENAMEFHPERFLDERKKLRIPPEFIPFQAGRRRCVGEEFGAAMVFLFVANLIKNFEFELSSPYDFDRIPQPGFTISPNKYFIKVTKRLCGH